MDVNNDVMARVKKRLSGETINDEVLTELVSVADNRLCIRLGEDVLPDSFQAICADAVVKMYRRMYYEGISSEGAADISTSFIDNVLAEYEQEIADWKDRKTNISGSGRVVSFL